jgi:hypothetical protein
LINWRFLYEMTQQWNLLTLVNKTIK